MKGNSIVFLFIVFVFFGSLFIINAYAVDNNCQIKALRIWQVHTALGCIEDRLDVLENNPASGEANTASNLGAGTGIFAQKVGVDLQFKSLVGSPDIDITSDSTTVTIDFNGTGGGESTTCFNVGSGVLIIKNTTAGNCFVKSLVGGTGITISNGTNTITITNSLPESTVCTNTGSVGEGIYVSGNCSFKKLLAGSGITLSSNGTRITITNSLPEVTSCNNVGTGNQLCSGGNVNIDTLIAGTGISISDTTDDWTFANTGVISNSCSGSLSCSGTNPSTFTDRWELLCQTSLGGTATSISCGDFTARQHLYVNLNAKTTTSTITTAYQFNGDTGANYAHRSSLNGAAQVTLSSTTDCRPQGATTIASGEIFKVELWINNNIATDRKVTNTVMSGDTATAVTSAPNYAIGACKWGNTASQITTVAFMRSAGIGVYNTGTELTVWGYD